MKKIVFLLLLYKISFICLAQTNVSLPFGYAGMSGSTIEIPVFIDNLTGKGIYAYDMIVSFDSRVLSATGISTAGTASVGMTIIPNNLSQGQIIIAAASNTALTGGNILIKIRFNIIGSTGSTSPLTISQFQWDFGPVNISNGTFTIVDLPVLWVVPDNANGKNEATLPVSFGNIALHVSNLGPGTMNWIAVTQDIGSWYTITNGQNGVNDGTIIVTYNENTNISPRKAKITVTSVGAYNSPREVTLIQSGSKPLPPKLNLPLDSSINISSFTTLSWLASDGTDSYALQISNNIIDWSKPIINVSQITGLSYTLKTALDYGIIYFWRVSATNSGGTSDWSQIRSFTTIASKPQSPTLISPLDNSFGISANPRLNWSAPTGAKSYDIQVTSNQNDWVASLKVNRSGVTETFIDVTEILLNSTKYYWRVRANNIAGSGDWSKVQSFKTVLAKPTLVSPSNGLTGVSVTSTFSWFSVNEATIYSIQITDSVNYWTGLIWDRTVTSTSFAVTPSLDGLRTYYWRVNATNNEGTSDWSTTYKFTTVKTIPKPPVLLNPIDNSKSVPIIPTFSWKSSGGANYYNLKVSLNSVDWSNPVIDNSNLTNISYTPTTPLLYDTVFYWKVNATNDLGTSEWSTVRSFRTLFAKPASPSLQTPFNGAINISKDPLLTWNPSDRASSYSVQLSLNDSFSNLILNQDGITSTFKQVNGLLNNTIYYWRVNATNATGTSDWSVVWNFKVIIDKPAIPTLLIPNNGDTNISLSPNLTWDPADRASSYGLQVSNSALFSNLLYNQSGITLTSQQINSLNDNTYYYWRVNASNDVGTSDWSSYRSFRTLINKPSIPTLSSPNNGDKSVPINPVLNWNLIIGASSYRLQLSDASDFVNIILDQDGIIAISLQLTNLKNNQVYYWRVSAKNPGGSSDWSNIWSFQTIIAKPSPPQPLSPVNGQSNVSYSTFLTWNPVVFSNSYRVQVSMNENFISLLLDQNITNDTKKQISNLTNNTKYFWRVNATNDGGTSDWSIVWNFTTFNYPASINVGSIINYPTYSNAQDYKQTDFRMVGLPGDSKISVDKILQGTQNQDWLVYWDNGQVSNYWIKFDGSSMFQFTIGRAFWIFNKGPLNISSTVPTAPLNSAGQAEIPLHSGWNLITNPFLTTVRWDNVNQINGNIPPIWSFDGSKFDTSLNFEPYKGYYFDNQSTLQTIKIPYQPSSLLFLSKPESSPDGWKINITLSSGGSIDRSTWLGVSKDAADGLDKFDFRKPPAFEGSAQIYFSHPEWGSEFKTLASDIRSESYDLKNWEFELSSDLKPCSLSFSGIKSIPMILNVVLIDIEKNRFLDLRKDSTYNFLPNLKKSKFNLIIGQDQEIKTLITQLTLPRNFILEQNYPNPFNPSTNIPIKIPTESTIKLAIYDILGKEIKIIFEGKLSPGLYTFNWDGKSQSGESLSSGLYFYRLISDLKINLFNKMVLMK